MMVLSMLLFGGPTLHYFALALTIGILFGIYSSVFVAAAIAMWLGIKREDLVKVGRRRTRIRTIRTRARRCRVSAAPACRPRPLRVHATPQLFVPCRQARLSLQRCLLKGLPRWCDAIEPRARPGPKHLRTAQAHMECGANSSSAEDRRRRRRAASWSRCACASRSLAAGVRRQPEALTRPVEPPPGPREPGRGDDRGGILTPRLALAISDMASWVNDLRARMTRLEGRDELQRRALRRRNW